MKGLKADFGSQGRTGGVDFVLQTTNGFIRKRQRSFGGGGMPEIFASHVGESGKSQQ